MNDVTGIGLPFAEAQDFFKAKLNIPTRRWNDIQLGGHAHGFMVAGAMKTKLLANLRRAVDKAIAGGTFRAFQKDFDKIVAKHGWQYNGGRGWRTRVIYQTNLRSAYQAGRYKQMTDPDVLKARPYWEYRHGDSKNPRPEHLGWNGLVLKADDPFWQTHYPSNGWHCSCTVRTLSRRDLKKKGKAQPDTAPAIDSQTHTDKATGQVSQVPRGIDPGFSFNIGEAAYGRPIARRLVDAAKGGKWVQFEGKGPADYGRGDVPFDKPKAKLGAASNGPKDIAPLLTKALGSDTLELKDAAGDYVVLDRSIARHIEADRRDGRERYFPLLKEIVEDPFEIWAGFGVNEVTGQYGLRRRYVKFFDLGPRVKDNRIVALVVQATDGVWTGLTVFKGKKSALNNLRKGVLVYARDQQ